MTKLAPFLPPDYCTLAARRLSEHAQRVFIVTGFLVAGRCETDGPPGALALAEAVRLRGGTALLLSDGASARVLAALQRQSAPVSLEAAAGMKEEAWSAVVDVPVLERAALRTALAPLVAALQPTAVVAIERCGPGEDGFYRNMRGEDISAVTAPLDVLFEGEVTTFGVGDGGNEIGLGALAQVCMREGVTDWPCVVRSTYPVLAAVSNWGAWGLLAAWSRAVGADLLPSEEEATRVIEEMVRLHCIDGVSRQERACVDGWTWEENLAVLRDLRSLIG